MRIFQRALTPFLLCGSVTLCGSTALPQETIRPGVVADRPALLSTPEGTSQTASLIIPDQFTLDQLEAIASINNPSLRGALETIEVARGIHVQVGLPPNPEIGYLGTQAFDKNTAGQQGGYLGQTFIMGKKLRWNRDIASKDIEQAEWFHQKQQYRVTNTVKLRYYEILSAQRQVALAESLVSTAQRMADSTEQLRKAGEGTKTDVLQAEIELEQAELLLNNARNQYQAAWKRLTSVMGVPQLEAVPVAGDLELAPPEFEWETTLAELESASPDLQAVQVAVSRASSVTQRARVEPIPDITTQISGQRDQGGRQNILNAQVGIALPLWNRNQGAIYAAVSDQRRKEAEVERMQLALRERLAQAFQRYENSRQQVQRYREKIIPRSQEVLNLVNTGYKQGELTFLQVLVAQRTYFQTNQAYLQALTEYWKSTVPLAGYLITEESETEGIPISTSPTAIGE